MSRDTYMKSLEKRLRRLPKEDYERAMEYFTEYFDEAGEEQEQKAMEDLGTPELAASQIIQNIAQQNAKEESKSVKRGLSKVWVALLAIFAAPIAIPLAFAMMMLVLSLLLVVLSLLMSCGVLIGALVIGAIPCFVGSAWLLFTSPLDGLASLGFVLIGLGIGIWVVKGAVWFSKYLLNKTIYIMNAMIKKGRDYAK